ncbi:MULTISPECIES: sulfotransferase family protein [Rhodobacterales]|uniref:sulfotransferase family protein n=1 Tax=Rhodobacterales TaxID=204455 RepID=UPI003272CB1E
MSKGPDRFVFIVTYGRSGSTLLQNLMNAIPGYQIRGENNNALLHMMQAWRNIEASDPLKGMRAAQETSNQTHPWFGGELIDPDRFGHGLAKCFTETVLNPDPDVRVSGFKEIRFHTNPNMFMHYLDFMHKYFPNAKFIFNTRDHASVAKSGWWAERPPQAVLKILEKAEQLYKNYLIKHSDRGLLMHYDDYVADVTALTPLYEFLEEEMNMDVIEGVMSKKLTHLSNET